MSALHWNTTHFERDFEATYLNAVAGYEKISHEKSVALHNSQKHLAVLETFKTDARFSINALREASLPRSYAAARRESLTVHGLEVLGEHAKGVFSISNYLGGEYHLTADEVYWENNLLVIQESKNSSRGKLPSRDDIKDGLFKLILFANMEEVEIDGRAEVEFVTRLKLTGGFVGTLRLPSDGAHVSDFCTVNHLTQHQQETVTLLNREAGENAKLQSWITVRDA